MAIAVMQILRNTLVLDLSSQPRDHF